LRSESLVYFLGRSRAAPTSEGCFFARLIEWYPFELVLGGMRQRPAPCHRRLRLASGTTSAGTLPAMTAPTRSVAARNAASTTWAYLEVELDFLCPSKPPTMWRLTPALTSLPA